MSNPKAFRAFISTNPSLSIEEILNIYVNRWEIEVFFRNFKTKLAFDCYQIRSSKGIKCFCWSLHYLILLPAVNLNYLTSRRNFVYFLIKFVMKKFILFMSLPNPETIFQICLYKSRNAASEILDRRQTYLAVSFLSFDVSVLFYNQLLSLKTNFR